MEEKDKLQVDTIDQLTEKWNNAASVYHLFDSCPQTLYYTLIHMLDLSSAHHILEVACGTCKLLSLALQIKNQTCTYLATDLCQNMVKSGKERVMKQVMDLGIGEDIDGWLKRHNLEFRVANAEEPIEVPYKFDRIIANLVVMATENPAKMMKNLNTSASEGCLLGVTIWGDQTHSNLLSIMKEAMQANNIPIPNERPHSHLFNKLEELAAETGWQIVLQWEQNAPFHFRELNDKLKQVVTYWCRGNSQLIEFYLDRITKIFSQKKVLNFPTQLAIMRKKDKVQKSD